MSTLQNNRIMIGLVGVIAVGVVVIAAVLLVGLNSQPLEERDAEGFEACQMLKYGRENPDDVTATVGGGLAAGEHAAAAETEAIRDTVEPVDGLEGFAFVDDAALEAACEDEGVNIPDE